MSVCINPNCPKPENQDTQLFCQGCNSELLLDGRYRVIRQLGGGGFGKTYEVRDSTPLEVSQYSNALKVLKVLNHNHPKYVELFQREAQFLSRFNHPGIPKVEADAYFTYFSYNSSQPLHCLVMEKIEGLDLKQYIQQRGSPINQKQAIKWLIQLMQILREIHSHNFFHRDIKPSNIMLRSDGQLVLIDFGTAREVTETYMSKQSAGQVTGLFSAGYSPLEQLNGQAMPQSDFFALGRTMVFLLTGKNPSDLYDFEIDQLKWRDLGVNLSPEFADFVDCMMARLPSQRPQSADAILEQLMKLYNLIYSGDSSPSSQMKIETSVRTHLPTQMQPVTSETPILTKPPVELQQTYVETASPPPLKKTLDSGFIWRCQQELAEYIGPVAAVLCQRTLSKNPNLSEADFIEALAQKIPNPQEAKAFRKKLEG